MKKIFIFSFLLFSIIFQLGRLSAQIVTTITPKVSLFPSSGFSYVDDPARYFNIQMINTQGDSKQVFITLDITCDFSATGENIYLKTKKSSQPHTPLTIGSTPVQLNRAIFDQLLGHLGRADLDYNFGKDRLADVLTLPEGNYRICITPYEWTGHNTQNPTQLGEPCCYSFTICYSGSAPEFTSPVNGFSAANLNNSNPANNLLSASPSITSDNRNSAAYTILPLQRTLNFNWTGVISNCLAPNDFNYTLKLVEVYQNQNVQEAIRSNATLATIDVKTKTMYSHDTTSNRHFRLKPGHVYAAQVIATLKGSLMTEVRLGNEGKSQVIAFVWGDVPVVQEMQSNTSSNVSDNRDEVLKSIRTPYLVDPGKDKTTIDALKKSFSSEKTNEPADDNYGTYVSGDEPYYKVKPSDSLLVKWMPVRGDSVFKVNYVAELYEYVGGPVANSMNVTPLQTKSIELDAPHDFGVSNTEMISIATKGWKDTLKEGYKYVLNLKAETFFSYNEKTTYTITDYIHGTPTNRDSVVNSLKFSSEMLQSNVVFAWGVDSGALDKVTPPQFTYPVDNSKRAWNDSTWTEIPEVVKREDFSFRWKAASGIDYGDSVFYNLRIAKLPKGKTPQQVKDTFYFKANITDLSYIDTVLFDSIKVNEQYLAILETHVKQMGDTSAHYNMLNGGKSLYATFKLKPEPEFKADINTKIKCFPDKLKDLSKETITPSTESLITEKKKLKIGDFPLVVQTATYDTTKKVYNGDGYVIWHPLGVDVRLKVHFDSVQINKNYEIIKGTAVSTATDSSTYLPGLMNDLEMDKWTNDDINNITSKLGENETIKGYYDKFQEYGEKYGKKYGGLLGPIVGENMATEVMTFPLSITDEDITGSKNIIFAINNMYFSPETSLMNLWAIFAAQSDNGYVPFLANNICMDQEGFLGNSSQHIELYMGRDYEFTMKDGYKVRFKASSDFANPKDGTVIVVDSAKLDYMMAEIHFDMDNSDVYGIEADGTPRKGKTVTAKLQAKIKEWDNWWAKITMDPFAVADCDRFTFVPTGKGIYYDHSSTETPNGITFPSNYLMNQDSIATANSNIKDEKTKKEKEDEAKKALNKATKEWQGFYWDELTVFLSDEISNTFTEESKDRKDSMVQYTYGINGTIKDSVHYYYPGSRINFGAKQLMIDHSGFTAELFARDLINAETKDGGGWAFSLDTIRVNFVKNKYKEGVIKGGFGIPLFSGGFDYNCSIGSDSLMFGITAKHDTLKLDLWVANVQFDSASSYFRIKKIYKEDRTRIDLTMNGKINVDFNKIGLPLNFALAKFEHMGMRNYNLSGKPKEGTASIDKFEFDIGEWSFASPQKTIGGAPSTGAGVPADDKNVASVSFGGFTFSITKLDPIIGFEGNNLKLGISTGGQIKFATEGTDLGASCGFSFWGIVNPKDHFKVVKVDGKLNSIKFDKINFEVFTLDGSLDFFDSKSNPAPGGTSGNGFGGSLKVTMMSKVELAMKVGFGSEGSGSSKYTWWYFDGACKFPGGIPLGAVSINGFSGGFAYNMAAKKSLTDPSYNAVNLLKQADKNTNEDKTAASGMDFKPSKNSWVANAGISITLTGQENTMNADGLVSLRIANKHFSGIFIDANAYVLSKMDKTKTPGDGSNNTSPLIRAKAIMGFETTKKYDYFRLSIAVKANINLQNLLEGVSSTTLGSALSGIHGGSSLLTSSNVTKTLDALTNNKSGLGSHTTSDRESAAAASNNSGASSVGFSVTASIPIDFELKYYKEKEGTHKKGSTDWYFAIGKPKYEERVQLKADLDLVICKSNAEFTFYMQTGNAFAYQMPPLSKDLQNFFFGSGSGKKNDASRDDIKKNRMISSTDWLNIDKGGGFCMGSTFHAYVGFDCFLYVHVTADLGFDVALMNVNGVGCPGHPQIGKHNFYALGRAYAALQGDVGLKLNLGFWKGEISLFKAGVGALLQGGGPNPSFAYGLLRFKVSMLNGLLKFNTSVDFSMGDVCVPGVGDPLANVKLFQNVTPGFSTEAAANTKSNLQSPLQVGTIVSNMPWDTDVYLSDGQTTRRFRFTLVEKNISYSLKPTNKNSYTVVTSNEQKLQFTPNSDDPNAIFFETKEGGFVEDCNAKYFLRAMAFERRKTAQGDTKNYTLLNGNDYPYYVTGANRGTKKTSNTSGYDWFDPTFYNEKTKKNDVKAFRKDTTMYFKTMDIGNSVGEVAVFSWPYNGDQVFPHKEYVHTGSGSNAQPYAMLYLYKQCDNLFDKTTLSNKGKQLKIFLLGNGGEKGDVYECSYTYYKNATVPYVKITLPKKLYQSNFEYGPRKLRFLMVGKSQYDSAVEAAKKAMTERKKELTQLTSNSVYNQATNAHKANTSSSGKKSVNIQNQQLDEIYNNKQSNGKDTMLYYRTQMKSDFSICSSIGECIYEWNWFVEGNFDTYNEFYRKYYNSSFASQFRTSSVYDYGTYNRIRSGSVNCYALIENPWPFMSYDPSELKVYANGCVMPPRAYFAIKTNGKGYTAFWSMHNDFYRRFVNLSNDFKETPLLLYRYTDNSGDVDYNFSKSVKDARTVNDASLQSELTNRLKGGLIRNYTTYFKEISLRVGANNDVYQNCSKATYDPTKSNYNYTKPVILKFGNGMELEPMDEKYFDKERSGTYSLGHTEARNYGWCIYDYATYAASDDIKKFADFFQENVIHAQRYNGRGWSHKVDYFKDYYSSKYRNSSMSYADFPYDMPEIYIVTHYMTALQNLYRATQKNYSYATIYDGTFQLCNKNDYYIPASTLQLKDAYWALHWWQSYAQTLDFEGNGFDRDFYYRKDNAKYYNYLYNRDLKSKNSSYKSSFLPHQSENYFPVNNMKIVTTKSIQNYICIYYMTAQSSDFENSLMQTAYDVKYKKELIFHPNAIYDLNDAYYTIPWSNTGTFMNVNLGNFGLKYIKDNYGNMGEFGR